MYLSNAKSSLRPASETAEKVPHWCERLETNPAKSWHVCRHSAITDKPPPGAGPWQRQYRQMLRAPSIQGAPLMGEE